MSMVDALLMSSAVKDKAKSLVCEVPQHAIGAIFKNKQLVSGGSPSF